MLKRTIRTAIHAIDGYPCLNESMYNTLIYLLAEAKVTVNSFLVTSSQNFYTSVDYLLIVRENTYINGSKCNVKMATLPKYLTVLLQPICE